mmetsp:Transcript_153050/g.264951  ORF Transcript_153050/g.264951 Transcript_153050/m.264951 type:complete len:88 (-) Transcript_153050:175-438(-)
MCRQFYAMEVHASCERSDVVQQRQRWGTVRRVTGSSPACSPRKPIQLSPKWSRFNTTFGSEAGHHRRETSCCDATEDFQSWHLHSFR